MKIVTWNCNGALRKKFHLLSKYSADLVIIQECENPNLSKDNSYKAWATNYIWSGDSPYKGLAIFAKNKISVTQLNWDSVGLKHFIACRINDSFNLVAVWCHGNTSDFQYIGQFWKYFHLNKSRFENCILAGDFNSNAIWDKPMRSWNHSDVIRELKGLKIESFYHHKKCEKQGHETISTFFLQRNLNKPYHLDYIFGSDVFSSRLKHLLIWRPRKWISISDHMPVVAEFY